MHIFRDSYVEAKVRGKRSFLLEPQQLFSLAEIRSQGELLSFLADGPYGPDLAAIKEGSSTEDIEKAIRQNFARTVNNLLSPARGGLRRFLIEYRRRFDAMDLATLLIYKSQGRTWDEFGTVRHPLGTTSERELRRLYSLQDTRLIVETVDDDAIQERIKRVIAEEITPDTAALIRDLLMGLAHQSFYRFVDEELSGRDKKSCTPLVGAPIDLLNIAVILRSKMIGIPNIEGHLVKASWKLNKKALGSLLASEDVAQTLDKLSANKNYRRILSGSRQKFDESKSLSFIELISRKHLSSMSHTVFLKFPFTLGVLLAYLVSKENEAMNLAAIISGVSAGLKSEQIRLLLAA